MEISIKDLIVPAKRAGEDLRGLISQIAAPAALSNIDAFKELLNQSARVSAPLSTGQRDHSQGADADIRKGDVPKRPTTSPEKTSQKDSAAVSRKEQTPSSESHGATSANAVEEPQDPDAPKKAVPVEDASSRNASGDNPEKSEIVLASLALPPTAAETAVAKVGAAPAANPLSETDEALVSGAALVGAPGRSGSPANGSGVSDASIAQNQDILPAQAALVAEQKKGISSVADPGVTDSAVETPPALPEAGPASPRAKDAPVIAGGSRPATEATPRPETAVADAAKGKRPTDQFLANASINVVEDEAASFPRFPRANVTGILAAQEIGIDHPANGVQVASANAATGSRNIVASGQPVPASNTQQATTAAIGIATTGGLDNEAADPHQARPAGINPVFSSPSLAGGAGGIGPRGSVTGFPASMNRAPTTVPVTIDQVSIHIARAAAAGSDHINIKLKPASLGQVDVRMELTHDGRVTAVITADRSDTLDLLQRDARSLEKALADAGLKTDQGALQFNLRGDQGSHRAFEQLAGMLEKPGLQPAPGSQPEIADLFGDYHNARAGNGGVDIRV